MSIRSRHRRRSQDHREDSVGQLLRHSALRLDCIVSCRRICLVYAGEVSYDDEAVSSNGSSAAEAQTLHVLSLSSHVALLWHCSGRPTPASIRK